MQEVSTNVSREHNVLNYRSCLKERRLLSNQFSYQFFNNKKCTASYLALFSYLACGNIQHRADLITLFCFGNTIIKENSVPLPQPCFETKQNILNLASFPTPHFPDFLSNSVQILPSLGLSIQLLQRVTE